MGIKKPRLKSAKQQPKTSLRVFGLDSTPIVQKKRLSIFIVVIVLALGATVILIATNARRKGGQVAGVCTPNIISRQNEAVKSVDAYAQKVKAIAIEVEAIPDYDRDPTCVFIVYRHYAYTQDVDKSRQLLNSFKALLEEGKQIDVNVIDARTVEQMEDYVKSLEHNRNIGDDADGSG